MKTSKNFLILVIPFLFLTAFAKENILVQGSVSVKGKTKAEYSSLAKISLQEAIAIATKNTNQGKVTEASLEDENDFLVYEIELVMPDHSQKELLIDAGDGKILVTKEENKAGKKEDEQEDD